MPRSESTYNTLPERLVNATSGQASASDPALYELMVRPWDLCNTPLDRGEFGYRIQYLKVPGITVYREAFDLPCRIRGFSPADTFVFSIPLVLSSRSAYWGSALETTGMPATLPGGLDVLVDRSQDQLLILIDSSLMRSRLPEESVKNLELAAASHLLPATRADVKQLGRWLVDLLNRACQAPEMLNHASVRESIVADILQQLATAVCPSTNSPSRPPPIIREKGFHRALGYIRQSDPLNLTIPEVCKAACVSQRTLQYAFIDALGMTLRDFLLQRRMHAARRYLMFTSPAHATVMDIAYRHGFYHLSRFAKSYRQLFGEQPSVTLKRSSWSDGQELSPLLE